MLWLFLFANICLLQVQCYFLSKNSDGPTYTFWQVLLLYVRCLQRICFFLFYSTDANLNWPLKSARSLKSAIYLLHLILRDKKSFKSTAHFLLLFGNCLRLFRIKKLISYKSESCRKNLTDSAFSVLRWVCKHKVRLLTGRVNNVVMEKEAILILDKVDRLK